jgi:hypothetical protein
VKVVITPATRPQELEDMVDAIASVDASTPLILQPVTPFGPVRQAPAADALLCTLRRLRRRLASVRLIPQTHAQLGIR